MYAFLKKILQDDAAKFFKLSLQRLHIERCNETGTHKKSTIQKYEKTK